MISIIICTRDRIGHLRETLSSIALCEIPIGLSVELLVVDNSASGSARQAVDEVAAAGIDIRYLQQPRGGVSDAKNLGVEQSHGQYLLLTDDDVRVPKRWIVEMIRPLQERTCDVVAGGVVLPEPQAQALRAAGMWKLRSWFADSHFVDWNHPTTLVGANVAFSRGVFETIGGFNPALGGGALGSFEETELAHRLLAAGFRIGARFDVQVEHHFDLARLDSASLRAFARRRGRSRGYYLWHAEGRRLTSPCELPGIIAFSVPRAIILPLLLPIWRDARAPWLSLVELWHSVLHNHAQSRLPRRVVGQPLTLQTQDTRRRN
jgi:GT2 family glycosyltransferase